VREDGFARDHESDVAVVGVIEHGAELLAQQLHSGSCVRGQGADHRHHSQLPFQTEIGAAGGQAGERQTQAPSHEPQ
jgi:hypothetical protein